LKASIHKDGEDKLGAELTGCLLQEQLLEELRQVPYPLKAEVDADGKYATFLGITAGKAWPSLVSYVVMADVETEIMTDIMTAV
jgi:hypothetical protein